MKRHSLIVHRTLLYALSALSIPNLDRMPHVWDCCRRVRRIERCNVVAVGMLLGDCDRMSEQYLSVSYQQTRILHTREFK